MGLNLVMYNIQDGQGFGLPKMIHAFRQGNYNLMLLTEMKIPEAVYCHNHLGYDAVFSKVTVTAAEGAQERGVGIVLQEWLKGWIVESMHFHGLNVARCKIVHGNQ